MADGSTKKIEDVQLGDMVLATDPVTGKTEARRVEDLHLNLDTLLTDLTVKVKAGGEERTVVLNTTYNHPFWDNTAATWVDAGDLTVGHGLLTPDGRTATVESVRVYVGATAMRDLTVADVHTYYVVAGNTPVLVHNCGGRWKVGDDYSMSDKNGNAPSMSTMRKRFWKNEAAEPDAADQYGAANVRRMKRGLAPQRQRPDGTWESMELSHEPIPARDGGTLLTPRWPEDHVIMDPGGHRRLPPGY
jgi:hypothetical protein